MYLFTIVNKRGIKHDKHKNRKQKLATRLLQICNQQKQVTKIGPHQRRHLRRNRKTAQNKNRRAIRRQKRRLIQSGPRSNKNMDPKKPIKPPLPQTPVTIL